LASGRRADGDEWTTTSTKTHSTRGGEETDPSLGVGKRQTGERQGRPRRRVRSKVAVCRKREGKGCPRPKERNRKGGETNHILHTTSRREKIREKGCAVRGSPQISEGGTHPRPRRLEKQNNLREALSTVAGTQARKKPNERKIGGTEKKSGNRRKNICGDV